MIDIYSKKDPDILLHIIHRKSDINSSRSDISNPNEFLQVATLKLDKGVTFKAHKHIWKRSPPTCIAQESWIVISGSVKCIFYDTDGTFICSHILFAGDASITFYGGHNYEILEDNTLVYEMKTGPYKGIEFDKVHI